MPRIILVSNRPEEAFSSLSNQVLQSDKGYPDILYDGRSYRSAEHLFRALRYPSHSPYHKDVQNAPTVAEAIAYVPKYAFSERLWRTRNRLVPGSQDWAMDVVLEAKFDMAANASLCEKLMRTQDAIIVNDDANDPIWGVGKNGRGDNLLGVRLMCVICGLEAAVKAPQSLQFFNTNKYFRQKRAQLQQMKGLPFVLPGYDPGSIDLPALRADKKKRLSVGP